MIAVDVDTVDLEKLDFEPACSVRFLQIIIWFGLIATPTFTPDCENPAVWKFTCRVCSAFGTTCDEHARAIRAQEVTCGRCQASGFGADLFEFGLLPGGAS